MAKYIYILYVSNQIQQNNIQHGFFLVTKSLSCSELIFPVSLAYYLSVCQVCSVLMLNLGAVLIGSDSILREVGAGGAKKIVLQSDLEIAQAQITILFRF